MTHPRLPVFILFLQVGPDGLQGFLWTHGQRICRDKNRVQHLPIRHICRETNYTKDDAMFSKLPGNAACSPRQDI